MGLNLSDKKHYIFDLDGTLIDSNSLHEKSFPENHWLMKRLSLVTRVILVSKH